MTMNNPLLENSLLPLFSQIKPEHIEPAIDSLLAEARALVEERLQTRKNYSWDKLLAPLETIENKLHKAWSPVEHLNAVQNSEELREVYNACLPKLSDFATEMGQNKTLFNAYRVIAKSSEFAEFDTAQQKIIRNALRDFRLSGIDLNEEQKQRYKEIAQELARFTSRYEENVLDATNAWHKLITHQQELAGLPASALTQAKQTAEQHGEEGAEVGQDPLRAILRENGNPGAGFQPHGNQSARDSQHLAVDLAIVHLTVPLGSL